MKKAYRFVALTSVLALSLASMTVPAAQADPGPDAQPVTGTTRPENISFAAGDTVNEVRLLTGDLVGLNSDGEVTQVTPGPRPDGSVPRFSMTAAESQTYVVPTDVEALVPDQLDRQLFNVTELSSYDLGDSIPVIVDQADATSVQEGTASVESMGVEVTETLGSVSAQVGLADVRTDAGPAPTWGLLQELDSAPTSADDPISTTTKVWFDKQIRMDLPQMAPTALDVAATEPAWMSLIGRDEAHAEGYTGEGITVAVVDSGIDSAHPDLVGQVVAQKDFTDENTMQDGLGHGTFVASEIAGTGAASNGTYTGIAPGAKLISARVLDSHGGGSDSGIIAGVEWAAQQGADIINLSLGIQGGYDDGTSFQSQAIDQIARQYGCLIVVAAGNDGGAQRVDSPATADEALSVGATYSDGSFASFSSYGPRRGDGAVKPEILAPGSNTPTSQGLTGAQAGTTTYMAAEGTSMAAPLVAGAAALVKQADPLLDRAGLRAKLMASATRLPLSVFQQGAGLLNIPAAIAQPVTTTPTQLNLGSIPAPYPNEVTTTLTYVNQGSHDVTFDFQIELTPTDSLGLPMDIPQDDTESDQIRITALADSTGDRLTVPAGRSATLDVTVNPAAYPTGYVGGYLTASGIDGTVIRTPIGWSNSPNLFTVSVSSVANPLTSALLINLDTGIPEEMKPDDSGVVVFPQVESGLYAIEAYSSAPNPDYGDTYTVIPVAPFRVDSDTSIELDPSTAQPVNFDFPQPIDQDGEVVLALISPSGEVLYASDQIMYQYNGSDYFGFFEPYYFASYGDEMYGDHLAITPVTDTTYGTWHLYVDEYAESPLVEASLDCGQTTIPMSLMSGLVDIVGQTSYTIVDDNQGLAQAPGPDSALLAQGNHDFGYDTAKALVDQAQNQGYAALIVDSTNTSLMTYWLEASTYKNPDVTIPVFVTPRPFADQLLAPGVRLDVLTHENVRYTYRFSVNFNLSTDNNLIVTPVGHTAAIQVEHRAMGPKAVVDRQGDYLDDITTSVPSTYTMYVEPDASWYQWTEYSPDFSSENLSGVEDTLIQYVDVIPELGVGEQMTYAPGSVVNSLSHDRNSVQLFEDALYVEQAAYRDGQGSVENRSVYTDYPDLGLSTMKLTDLTTSEVVFDGVSDDLITTTDVTRGHTYQLDQTSTTPKNLWEFSNTVTARWTWNLQWTGDGEDQALREVWYELPGLDAYNAGSESQQIVIHVGHTGESVPEAEQVVLKASVDSGSSWTDIPVQLTSTPPQGSTGSLHGEDLYVGQISAHDGDMVWLQSSVSGGGSSFDQTVEDAYPVTSTPRDFPQQTWSCEGGDVTPPDAPRVDMSNASEVSGGTNAAEPGSTVTVRFPDGTIGTDVAGGDGSYSVPTPSGMVSGSVSVTATDASNNVSAPTTSYLDADRPDPARIDRADMTEVSGSVGAVEAFAWVNVTFPDGTTVTTQAAENGSYSVATPSGMAEGTVTVTVVDAGGNISDSATAQLAVTATSAVTLALRYSQLNPGQYQYVTASGFRTWERVTVSLCSASGCSPVRTASTTFSGKLSTSFLVPKDTAPGNYTVTLTGSTSGTTSASFEVVAPPPPSTQCWFTLFLTIWFNFLGW